MIPALAPMATPPAKEAFKTYSIEYFVLLKDAMEKVPAQLPIKDITVFIMMICLSMEVTGKSPALKDGQKRNKKNVPKKAYVTEKWDYDIDIVGLTFFEIINETVIPVYAPKV